MKMEDLVKGCWYVCSGPGFLHWGKRMEFIGKSISNYGHSWILTFRIEGVIYRFDAIELLKLGLEEVKK